MGTISGPVKGGKHGWPFAKSMLEAGRRLIRRVMVAEAAFPDYFYDYYYDNSVRTTKKNLLKDKFDSKEPLAFVHEKVLCP